MAFQKGHKTNLGRKHSEVSITKMRESQRGQKRSEKVKKKLSDIRKKLWAKPEFKQRSYPHSEKIPHNWPKKGTPSIAYCNSGTETYYFGRRGWNW